jgi:FAD/FMN-containing dehydrogenase
MSRTPHVPPTPPDPSASTPNRREFLLGAVGGAALALPAAAMAMGAASCADLGPDWAQLERTLKGKLLRPDVEGYAEAIKVWNLNFSRIRPAGVAMVADAKDIATALAWAQDNRVEMVSRSGGHSYAAYSSTPGLVINLKEMTGVTVDPANGTMTTTGSATNEGVAVAGKPCGRAIPGGQCPTVGVAGFVLGGGLGFYMRQHGLAIDSLLSTEIVTADGKLRHVPTDETKDLFWALRGGGGGNFGINTSFTFRTFAVPERVTIFNLKWYGDACVRAFLAFQELLQHAPDTLGAIAHFGAELGESKTVRPYLRLFGQVAELQPAVEKLLAPVIASARPEPPPPSLFEEMDFWAAKTWLGGGNSPPSPNPFLEKSMFHPKPLPESAIGTLVENLAIAPISSVHHAASSSFFAWGGAVARVPADATAFAYRDDVWLETFDCSWGPDTGRTKERLIAWLDVLYGKMKGHGSDRCYVNFVDPQLADPLPAYYGVHLPRLVEVKRKYDPNNVFHFAQSIQG